jgi:hypothetical protein
MTGMQITRPARSPGGIAPREGAINYVNSRWVSCREGTRSIEEVRSPPSGMPAAS